MIRPKKRVRDADQQMSTTKSTETPKTHWCPQECPKPPKLSSCSNTIQVCKKNCRHFWVLMWKHMTIRLRKFIVTPIELVSPCFVFIILILLKPYLLELEGQEKMMYNVGKSSLRTHEVPIKNILPPHLVLYTPASVLAGQLMDRAGWRMGLVRLTVFPDATSSGYYGIPDDSLLYINDLISKMSDDSAIVMFQDLDDEEWPDTLNYTIRMKKDLTSEENENNEHLLGAVYEPFMRLQWAIDSSFILLHPRKEGERQSNTELPTITLSEIPLSDERQKRLTMIVINAMKNFCPMSLLLPFVFLLTRLIAERTSGVQELVKQVGVSFNTWAMSHSCNMILTGLCYSICGTYFCKASSSPMIPHSNIVLLILLFELHFHATMTYAFICNYLSASGEYATTLAVVIYVLSMVPSKLLTENVKLSMYVQPLTGLIPHVPLKWFWTEVEFFEMKDKGLRFADIRKSHTKRSQSVLIAYLMMMLQCGIYFWLAGYLNEVCPGKYGTRKPWNYMCKKKDNVASAALQEVQEEVVERDKRYFEDSQLTNIGIDIEHVTKIFDKKIVLSNVSFYVYQGEITILLGHNGAGKTTLMSIITGMLSPTSGRIHVNGMDVSTEQTKVHSIIGMCPQHNLFFPDLKVMEHVRLFAMLKGESFCGSKRSSKALLEQLGILDKKNFSPDQISGGMKRRLQLACALAGGSNVLILDEPTSGLDVETRRELWNLLLSLRGERTVLLSTHFMEEADALGDRIVAIHSGRLQCHASPMYLKKNMGTGYRLSLTTTNLPQEENITAVVTSVIPNATVKESGFNTITYNLPSQDSEKFSQLFTKLESKRSKLEIVSIGVGVSSLEEVFLKLCSDVDTTFTEEAVDTGLAEPEYSKITGCVLHLRQICVLIRRNLKYIKYNKYSFLALEVLIPIAIILLFALAPDNNKDKSEEKKLSDMSLDAYNDVPTDVTEKTVLMRVNSPEEMSAVDRLAKHYNNVAFQLTRNVGETLFRASKMDRTGEEIKKYIAGVELGDTNVKVMYTKSVRHAAPITLNLLSNILAAQHFPRTEEKIITTNYQPLGDSLLTRFDSPSVLEFPKDPMNCGMWLSILVIVVLCTLVNSVALPTLDRLAGTRHIHTMAGCPPLVHWLSTFVTHIVTYTLVLLLPVSLISFVDRDDTFNNIPFIGSLLLILVLGSMAYLMMCYLTSFSLSKRGSGILLTHLVILLGFLPGALLFVKDYATWKPPKWLNIPCSICYYIFPGATLTLAALKAGNVARLNAYCNKNLEKCRHLLVLIFQLLPPNPDTRLFDAEKCCLYHKGKTCSLCLKEYAPGKEMIIMAVQTVFYGTLVVLTQYGIFNGLCDRIFNVGYKQTASKFHDKYVEEETTYVGQKVKEPLKELKEGEDALLVHNLHKNYIRCCKSLNAVKGINFSVKKGECFGLLGVNGAGKSTTFNMISGNEVPTRGKIYANGYFLKWPRSSKYLQSLGYCPQYSGLDEFLTGNDNLATLLTLVGLHSSDIIKEVKTWIEVVGLEKYRDVLVQNYSGGCMRRLATAAALSTGASITLLDEPTAGVDVSARRRVWLALRKGLRRCRSIIITSHSMDEMEALCNRIAIMSGGEIDALGSAPALRSNYAAGHALYIKLKSAGDAENVQKLKEAVLEKFNCTLKDDHITMLHYHINETMPYSEIFNLLKQLKKKFPDTIEDYSVAETTLEEVFLSFAQPKTSEGEESGDVNRKKQNKKKKK